MDGFNRSLGLFQRVPAPDHKGLRSRWRSPHSLISLFWLTLALDIPRYCLGFTPLFLLPRRSPEPLDLTTSAVIAGYNEAAFIRRAVEALQGQINEIIVVNDGSNDGMREICDQLHAEGKVHKLIHHDRRESKPTAANSGIAVATQEIVFIIDADTRFDPQAIRRVLGYFRDPQIAGVSLNLRVDNESVSLVTRAEAIEYYIGITASRQVAAMFGILNNISGACGAFRRKVLISVGCYDIEVAEDSALAIKLRQHGWKLAFAHEAHAYTNVPETLTAFTWQRIRWDAGIITMWWRKYAFNLKPGSPYFTWSNFCTTLDVVWFSAILPLLLPFYLFSVCTTLDELAPTLLVAVTTVLITLDFISFILAKVPLRLLPYLPFYTALNLFVMRPVRLIALLGELIFVISHHDNYIPKHQRWRLS